MKFILRFIILAVTIFVLSKFVTGFSITSLHPIYTIVISALLLTILHVFIKPVLRFFTMPINIVTLGLFSIVVNALLLWVVAWYVDGFGIQNFMTALISALIISIVNFVFGYKS